MSPSVLTQSVRRLHQESSSTSRSETTTKRMPQHETSASVSVSVSVSAASASVARPKHEQSGNVRASPSSSFSSPPSAITDGRGENDGSLKKKKRKTNPDSHKSDSPPMTLSPPTTTATATATVTTAASSKRKDTKKSSPFRIKVGCVVAVRYRPTGNHITLVSPMSTNSAEQQEMVVAPKKKTGSSSSSEDTMLRSSLTFSDVWTDPQPGRDDGLALIGKRIRCCFPSSLLSQEFHPFGTTSSDSSGKKIRPTTRMLEGEVVAILDYPSQVYTSQQHRRLRPTTAQQQNQQQQSSSSSCYGTRVELLVEHDRLIALPFLKRTDPVVDVTKLSDAAKRGHVNEEQIRGKNKAIVEVTLADSSGVVLTFPSSGSNKGKGKGGDNVIVARWVIRKRVPATLPVPSVHNTTTPIKDEATSDNKKSRESSENKSSSNQLDATTTNDNKSIQGETSAMEEETQNKNDAAGSAAETIPPKKKKKKGTNVPKDVSSAARYVGDGNDPTEQQEKNWRWQAGRYNNLNLFLERPIPLDYLEMLSYGLMVGEVIKVQPALPPASSTTVTTNTLAWVTIKRLILPEHTQSGRMPHHDVLDLFDDYDSTRRVYSSHFQKNGDDAGALESTLGDSSSDDALSVYFNFPIEELVIVSRKVKRNMDASSFSWSTSPNVSVPSENPAFFEPVISASYTLARNQYYPLATTTSNSDIAPNKNGKSKSATSEEQGAAASTKHLCHRCRLLVDKVVTKMGHDNNSSLQWCKPCVRFLKRVRATRELHDDNGHSKMEWGLFCDCDDCNTSAMSCLENDTLQAVSQKSGLNTKQQRILLAEGSEAVEEGGTAFLSTRVMLRTTMRQGIDFGLPPSFLTRATPSSKTITKVRPKTPKKVRKNSLTKNSSASVTDKTTTVTNDSKTNRGKGKISNGTNGVATMASKEATAFLPTSCRLLPYNSEKRRFDASALELYPWTTGEVAATTKRDKPRDLRLLSEDRAGGADTVATEKEIKTMNSRAARANQRRLMRDVAAIGLSLDTLSGREQQLRFDRSAIHAWGVFADDDLREGEMLIEYRGEIIGNAMAEKREKEYEAAKIGSDYMFRIDDFVVCDATKQGNVARFINASCDPNCYTKIISIDGSKRIAIYAKRDIRAGEELCYDYKFPLEYDEVKRIPCHCRARDCRGFMNWDKKYVAVPESDSEEGIEHAEPASSNNESANGKQRARSAKRFKHATADNAKEG